MRKIDSFFVPVSAARRKANLRLDEVNFNERLVKEAEERMARREKSDADKEARRLASNKRRIEARKDVDERTDFEKLQDQIDAIVDDDIILKNNEVRTTRAKTWSKRPVNWKFIAEESKIYGTESVIRSFGEEFAGLSATASRQRVVQWRKDLVADPTKTAVNYRLRTPAYGAAIEQLVLLDINLARSAGISLDFVMMRRYLLIHLEAANLLGLLKENGGLHTFSESWAARFCKRHNLVSRVATTKMREAPADFDIKKATYIKIGSQFIYQYRVPPALVINCDETAVQLVNISNRTWNVKGAKRVRVHGIGSDKAQITTTIFVTEEGKVLPFQMIFTGKTDRCHPSHVKPDGCIWAHTQSHWQSVSTYCDVIKEIVIPYKNDTIRRLNLPINQVTILKHDLHFTHKDEAVLALMRNNNIVPLFVPAGCTDLMQECDTVVNKPFKNGVRNAYRDHMDGLLAKHRAEGGAANTFNPKLTMGALKPFLTSFVQRGVEAISTPAMQVTIATAFANDGLFAHMRSPEVQLAVQLEGADLLDHLVHDVENEPEESGDELSAFSGEDSDSGNESD